MSDDAGMDGWPTEAWKPLAWEGVGIRLPRSWDVTGHRGFWRQGIIKAKSPAGARLELAWQQADKRRTPEQQAGKLWPEVQLRSWAVGDSEAGFVSSQGFAMGVGASERHAFLAQTPGRLAVLTMQGVESDLAKRIARSLRVAGRQDGNPFAVLEFAVTAPADYELVDSSIQAGVCLFGWRQGRRRIQFRRFSAGHAVMGLPVDSPLNTSKVQARFEAWVGMIYARQIADARHVMELEEDASGRLIVTLQGRRRRLMPMEVTSLIPQHRRQYRYIRVVWDKPSCKVYCAESTHDTPAARQLCQQILDSFAVYPCPGQGPSPLGLKQVIKRDVKTTVTDQGRYLVEITCDRPKALGLLPLLLGHKPNREPVVHKAELDPIGRWLWEQIDRVPLEHLISQLQDKLSLCTREARMSILMYLQMLAKWRMLDITPGKTDRHDAGQDAGHDAGQAARQANDIDAFPTPRR